MDFVAIDFETANEQRASACAAAIARVRGGAIVRQSSWLLRPPELRFSARNTAIHGIALEDVQDKPEFPAIWDDVRSELAGGIVVAHSASFDVGVLRNTLQVYGLPPAEFRYVCTKCIAKAMWPALGSFTLSTVAQSLGIPLEHHRVADDASACASITLRACAETGSASVEALAERLGIRACCFSDSDATSTSAWKNRSAKCVELRPRTQDIDPTHPLFERTVVFTGPLVSMDRIEAMQLVVDVGGIAKDSMTKKTNYLVVGGAYFDVFSHKTAKVRKALAMSSEGADIDIIGEDDFLKLLLE